MQFSFAATYIFSAFCLSFVLPKVLDLHTDNHEASKNVKTTDCVNDIIPITYLKLLSSSSK